MGIIKRQRGVNGIGFNPMVSRCKIIAFFDKSEIGELDRVSYFVSSCELRVQQRPYQDGGWVCV